MKEVGSQAIYMSVYYGIIEDILDNKRQKGDMLPTQNELAERFGVSRVTIREAIKELCRRGIVQPIKGKGTIILEHPQVLSGNNRTMGLTNNSGAGFESSVYSKLIKIEVVPADSQKAATLTIPRYSLLVRITRVRMNQQVPVCIDDVFLVNKYVSGIDFFNVDLEQGSLYDVLKEKAGILFERVEEQFRAVGCPKEIGVHLGLKEGEPILQIQRISYNEFGQAIEYCMSYQRSDMYYNIIQSKRSLRRDRDVCHYDKIAGLFLGVAAQDMLPRKTNYVNDEPREMNFNVFSCTLYQFLDSLVPGQDLPYEYLMRLNTAEKRVAAATIVAGLLNPGDGEGCAEMLYKLGEANGISEEVCAVYIPLSITISYAMKKNATSQNIMEAGCQGVRLAEKTNNLPDDFVTTLEAYARQPVSEMEPKIWAKKMELQNSKLPEDRKVVFKVFSVLSAGECRYLDTLAFAEATRNQSVVLLTGAVCGALHGEPVIPAELYEKISNAFDVEEVTSKIANHYYQ